MPKSKDRGHRERRKSSQPLPAVEPLGHRVTMPRRTNRSALRYIAEVGRFWDRRKVSRKAWSRRLSRDVAEMDRRSQVRLDRLTRERMLTSMPGWVFDHRARAFVAQEGPPHDVERIEQLIRAVIGLGPESVNIRVIDLSRDELREVRKHLSKGSYLVPVSSGQYGRAWH